MRRLTVVRLSQSSKRARYEEEDTPDTTSGDEDIEDEELMNREVKRRMARIPAENVTMPPH